MNQKIIWNAEYIKSIVSVSLIDYFGSLIQPLFKHRIIPIHASLFFIANEASVDMNQFMVSVKAREYIPLPWDWCFVGFGFFQIFSIRTILFLCDHKPIQIF